MRTADEQAKKEARRRFADGAAVRIGALMHRSLSCGREVTRDMYRRWWCEEAKVAKAAGLYAASTYADDAATALEHMAEERGWSASAAGGDAATREEKGA